MTDASSRRRDDRTPIAPRVRPPLRTSIIGGIVAVVVVLGIGGVLAVKEKTQYTAETSVVILPDANLPSGTSASYYETLSDGQIVSTYAEVANNAGFTTNAESALNLSDAQKSAVTAQVTVVPNTSVLLITVTAGEAQVAENVADEISTSVVGYVTDLNGPYRGEHLAGSDNDATLSSTKKSTIIGLTVVVAIIAGVVIQQLIFQLQSAVATRRRFTAVRPVPRILERAPGPDPHPAASPEPAPEQPQSDPHEFPEGQ